MSTNQNRQTRPAGSSETTWRPSVTGQQDAHQCTGGCFHQNDKGSLSRRSIDWRDSGIVIDDNHLFQSFESIGVPYDSRASIVSLGKETSSTQTGAHNEDLTLSQDEDGDTILHLAVVGFTLNRVEDLIGSCDLNAINDMMQTPLHVATLAERLDMVQLLIERGAKLDVYDRRGNTPLHLACQKGFVDIARAILDALPQDSTKTNAPTRNRSIESCNFDGFTCLHLAAMSKQNKIIELLATKYQANMGARDSKSGETILHKAIRYLNVELVKFLLDQKLHNLISMTDFSARNPLDVVEMTQQSATIISADRSSKLGSIRQLIEDCVRDCALQGGCCLGRSDIIINEKRQDLSDSTSSSSDYSDSD